MTDRQRLELKLAESRRELRKLALADETTDEALTEAEAKVSNLERRAALLPDDPEPQLTDKADLTDGEGREFRSLERRARVRRYVAAQVLNHRLDGAEAELNGALKMAGEGFPLRLLAPKDREVRTTTDSDAGASQSTWVDRLFADSMAQRLGITMPRVASGEATFPVMTAGASAAQRGRKEPASDATWTVGVTKLEPTRNAVRAVFVAEDASRLRGLEDALRRDLTMALTEGIDRTIFIGDADANENRADITGLTTASNVTEVEITQAEKVKGGAVLGKFVGLLDGKHAATLGDLRTVFSVGAATLFEGSFVEASDLAEYKTTATFLREAGLSWGVRGEIETDTANGDFGGFIGRARGIEGAGVAPVWEDATLIRDPYSGSAKGEIALTLTYQWAFALPRPSSFARLKFVT